jgi:hypothetical protein
MLETWSSWSQKCFCLLKIFEGARFWSGINFQTIISPDLEPVMTVQASFWMLACDEVYWFLEMILLGSSIVEAITVHVVECPSIKAEMDWFPGLVVLVWPWPLVNWFAKLVFWFLSCCSSWVYETEICPSQCPPLITIFPRLRISIGLFNVVRVKSFYSNTVIASTIDDPNRIISKNQ